MIDFKKLAENYKKDALNSLLEFLSINSVYDEQSHPQPYSCKIFIKKGFGVAFTAKYSLNPLLKFALEKLEMILEFLLIVM